MAKSINAIRLSKYDKIWAKKVRERDGACLYCGSTEYLNAHHFKGRASKSTRLMLENGVTLCSKHHVFSSEWSAHKTPEKFTKWFKKNFADRYKLIIKKAQTMMSERLAIQEFINETEN